MQSLRDKTEAIQRKVTERSIDVLALSETWHKSSDDICVYSIAVDTVMNVSLIHFIIY